MGPTPIESHSLPHIQNLCTFSYNWIAASLRAESPPQFSMHFYAWFSAAIIHFNDCGALSKIVEVHHSGGGPPPPPDPWSSIDFVRTSWATIKCGASNWSFFEPLSACKVSHQHLLGVFEIFATEPFSQAQNPALTHCASTIIHHPLIVSERVETQPNEAHPWALHLIGYFCAFKLRWWSEPKKFFQWKILEDGHSSQAKYMGKIADFELYSHHWLTKCWALPFFRKSFFVDYDRMSWPISIVTS